MAPNLYPVSVDADGSTQMSNFVSYLDSMLSKRIEVLRPEKSLKEEDSEDADFDAYDDSYSEYI